MRTPETNAERLVTFTDAVAAIAITLLVLPLVDLVPAASASGESLGALLSGHGDEILAFTISFVVIARLWWAHHQVFRHVALLTPRLVLESMVWTFTIVVLPLPTAIITAYSTTPLSLTLYIGTLIVASAALTAVAVELRVRPELSGDHEPMRPSGVLGIVLTLVAFVLALLAGLLIPGVGFWGMLLAAVTGWVQVVVERRWDRQGADRAAAGGTPDPAASSAAAAVPSATSGDNEHGQAADPRS
ncbi:TMEM175 family protein [Curtobacterium sp. RRHDQ10]|uniref:TMEM175 family protein n=1 Tax=Curtobacterium phyllosphaerae TaxID=3413379 RepID=UPI003BF31E7B